jgi:hypothetical protein
MEVIDVDSHFTVLKGLDDTPFRFSFYRTADNDR